MTYSVGRKALENEVSPDTADPRIGVGLLATLGRFAHGLRLSDVPAAVLRQAKLCVLDTVACMVAGADTPETAALLAAESARDSGGVASVFCSSRKLSPPAAARVNGYMGDIFELNDLIAGHASIGSVTATMALAEGQRSTGADLLKAVIAGIEVTSRIYSAYYTHIKPYTETGITPPGVINSIGSAGAASAILGLDEERTTQALAVAGALAGWCPTEVIFGDGGTVKPMLFGAWPASVGMLAAQYACHGVSGPSHLLESRIGYFSTVARAFDANAILNDSKWYLAEPRRKMHACCGYIHSAIDVIAELRRTHGNDLFYGDTIDVGFPDYTVPAVSKGRFPTTSNEARFHAQYCLAVVACGADKILPEHSMRFEQWMGRKDVQDVMGRITISARPGLSHYHQCTIDISGGGHGVVSAKGSAPKGSPNNPLSDDEVIEKFMTLTAGWASLAARNSYLGKTLELEEQSDCDWLFTTFRRMG